MKRSILAAFLVAATSAAALAQTPADHEAHHPSQTAAPGATGATQPGMGGSGGMMGGGMMQMMEQMGQGMGMPACGAGGMGMIDHVEGRIAYLRAELKITDAQGGAWNAFADALRTNAKLLGEVRASAVKAGTTPQTLADRLAFQEKWLTARLEGVRAMKSTFTGLYAVLSDDQKKTADEILVPHMGMMPMMSGMQPQQTGAGQPTPAPEHPMAGQMGPAQMQPGQMMHGK